jgi:hypothetical protein
MMRDANQPILQVGGGLAPLACQFFMGLPSLKAPSVTVLSAICLVLVGPARADGAQALRLISGAFAKRLAWGMRVRCALE